MTEQSTWRETGSGIAVPSYRRDNVEVDPPLDWPAYRSTELRAPKNALVEIPHTLSEITGPMLGEGRLGELDHDLTRQHAEAPMGQRINLSGRVIDGNGRPIPNTLVEIWQANAAGRYNHKVDRTPAPLDPNFTGVGRCVTDSHGHYRFVTIKPGAYPWGNHPNAWRPAHIHFSLFGRAFTQRLVTQMYFPGDPLFPEDPIFNSVRDAKARERMISSFDWDTTEDAWALGFKWDIVLRGPVDTPLEEPHE
jgi:protocatechuate 3,4-dioxygenase beta subunit